MAIKRPKPEEIVVKLRQVEVLMGQGMPRSDAHHPLHRHIRSRRGVDAIAYTPKMLGMNLAVPIAESAKSDAGAGRAITRLQTMLSIVLPIATALFGPPESFPAQPFITPVNSLSPCRCNRGTASA